MAHLLLRERYFSRGSGRVLKAVGDKVVVVTVHVYGRPGGFWKPKKTILQLLVDASIEPWMQIAGM